MNLPWELILDIVQVALDDYPRYPVSLILLNSTVRDLCLSRLHSELRFRSVQQLDKFINCTTYLKTYPESITVILAGGSVDNRLFKLLYEVVQHCLMLLRNNLLPITYSSSMEIDSTCLNLHQIYFCLNSLTGDTNINYLERALSLTEYAYSSL